MKVINQMIQDLYYIYMKQQKINMHQIIQLSIYIIIIIREDFDDFQELKNVIQNEEDSNATPNTLYVPLDVAGNIINNVMGRASSSAKELPLGKISKRAIIGDENKIRNISERKVYY